MCYVYMQLVSPKILEMLVYFAVNQLGKILVDPRRLGTYVQVYGINLETWIQLETWLARIFFKKFT